MEIKNRYGKVIFSSGETTIRKEVELAVKGNVKLDNADLYNANLVGARITGKNMLSGEGGNTTNYIISTYQIKDGWAVTIGCELYLFDFWEDLSNAISLYIDNPDEARKKYKKGG